MAVPSFVFLGFAALAALLINLSPKPAWRRIVLLGANIAFLLSFTQSAAQLAPFLALLTIGFIGTKLMEVHKQKGPFIALVILLVAAFCVLKRYTFMPHQLFLPYVYFIVGLSYVFFRLLHVVIDAFQDALPERVNLLSYINYTLNFTSLISGPIQLYQDYRRSEDHPAPLGASDVRNAFERLVYGFLKVSVVSPILYAAHQYCIGALELQSALPGHALYAGLIVAVYPVYLYINFSGYMDFVIGVARFLRLELPENFNAPFLAEGFIEFWARWHMTLSNWLKTYVYSPLLLSLMRRFPSREVETWLGVLVYFVTFFLIGVWHGPTANFLFYGVLLGLGVSVNKLYQIVMLRRIGRPAYRQLCANPLYSSVSRGVTFSWFAFSLLWFWSTWAYIERSAFLTGPAALGIALLGVIAIASIALAGLKVVEDRWMLVKASAPWARFSPGIRTAWCAALVVITLSVTVVLNAPAPHIVYRGF